MNFGWGDKIAPRVGFAYDVKGDGKTKLYGSYGVFYDTMKLEMPRGAWGGDKWISYYYTLDTSNWPSIDCPDGIGDDGCNGGTFIESINFRHTSNEPGSEIGQVDPNLKPTQKHEYTFGLDRELRARMSLGVRYAHKGWDETIDDIGVCAPSSQVCGEVYNIANPGKGIGKSPITAATVPDRAGGGQRLRRRSSSSSASATRTTGRRRRASCSAACMATTAGSRARTKTAAQSPNVSRYYDSLFLSFDREGQRSDRPPEHRSSGPVQAAGRLHDAVGHQRRPELLRVQRAAPVVDGDLPGRSGLLQRPRRPGSHADAQPDRPAGLPRLQDRRQQQDRPPGERHQPVRPGDGDRARVRGLSATRWSFPDFGEPVAEAFFQPGGFDMVAIQAARLPASGRPSPTYKQANAFQGARSIRVMARIAF